MPALSAHKLLSSHTLPNLATVWWLPNMEGGLMGLWLLLETLHATQECVSSPKATEAKLRPQLPHRTSPRPEGGDGRVGPEKSPLAAIRDDAAARGL